MKKTICVLLAIYLVMSIFSGCNLTDEQLLDIQDALVDEATDELKDEIKDSYTEALKSVLQSDGQLHWPKTPEIKDQVFFRSVLGDEVLIIKCSHESGWLINHYTTYEIIIAENGETTYTYTLPKTLCEGHGFFTCTGELASMEDVCGKSKELANLYAYFTDVTSWLAYEQLITNSLSDEELEALLFGNTIDAILDSKCDDIAVEMVGGMVDELISFNDVASNAKELKDKLSTAMEDRVGLAETQNMSYYYVPMLSDLVHGFHSATTPIKVANLKADLQLLGYEQPKWESWTSKSGITKDDRDVELRVRDSQIQWRFKGEGKSDWKAKELGDRFAKDGLLVELRVHEGDAQYRVLLDVEHILHDAQQALHNEVKRLAISN